MIFFNSFFPILNVSFFCLKRDRTPTDESLSVTDAQNLIATDHQNQPAGGRSFAWLLGIAVMSFGSTENEESEGRLDRKKKILLI